MPYTICLKTCNKRKIVETVILLVTRPHGLDKGDGEWLDGDNASVSIYWIYKDQSIHWSVDTGLQA